MAGGLNLYGFANGDPVNFSDPFGLLPCCSASDMEQAMLGVGRRVAPAQSILETAANIVLFPLGGGETEIARAVPVVANGKLGRLVTSMFRGQLVGIQSEQAVPPTQFGTNSRQEFR